MLFPYKIIDLTHIINSDIPTWDGNCGFQHKVRANDEDSTLSTKFLVQDIEMQAGIGTHMDAPLHCINGGKSIAEIPLENLVAPVFVIDVSDRAQQNYKLSVKDILDFELKFGDIAPDSVVIIRTGWDQFWNDPIKYRNDLSFPAISAEAASLLLSRDIKGLGVDTLSPDSSESQFPVHQLVLGAGKYIIENIANSKELPPIGAYIMALPIKIAQGSEAPIRLVGLINKEDCSFERMETILDLGDDINEEEKNLSLRMLELTKGKKIIATRILFNKRKELFIEFDDGTRLFVDNFNESTDISIL
jgi:kynurenine formamidase